MPRRASRFASAAAFAAALAALLVAAATGSRTGAPSGALAAKLAAPAAPPALASDRIYFVLTDRYANGDPSNDSGGYSGDHTQTGYDPSSTAWWHGGDFAGLTGTCTDPVHGLARIKSLGFNAIWVTPPVVNQVDSGGSGGYHGYWGLDFTRVDPHLGTNDDFGDFVSCAHSLGLKVIMDVVVNHTGDVVQLSGGSSYATGPYRDCHGRKFDPARSVGKTTFPCLSAGTMPRAPFVFPGQKNAKAPAWLNNPLNYHDRGDIDFSSCDEACYEQGDFYGLDDLFTEKPNVERGLAQIYAGWVTRYKLDGFRVDTARHVNAGFFRLWVPQILAAARAAGVPDFSIFGEVFETDAFDVSAFVRDRGLPSVLDFPFQNVAASYAGGISGSLGVAHRLEDDDYYRLPDGREPAFPTFLGNHDMGRAALQISQQGGGSGDTLLQHVLFGYDLLYLLRGAPTVYYGDEVGMIGSGGDQQARQDMFPTQVQEWKSQPRVGSPPIGNGSSFDVLDNPIEIRLRKLAALREAHPALATGASLVRAARGPALAVSRIDAAARREYLVLLNNGPTPVRIPVATSTPSADWTALLGDAGPMRTDAKGAMNVTIPPEDALLLEAQQQIPVAKPPKPKLAVRGDPLTDLWAVTAGLDTSEPLTVAFAIQRGSGGWKRLAIDDSRPYRAFLEPAKFRKNERVRLVAIARALDGSTTVSAVVPFRVHGR
ncbi:MAG TPA: alpha-amylase family glycosyl hydrolase [Gaiellaceae bacterium]|nr:alpha-amylase family glycosyl hydrolase [Gaiellaceae bacterium]